MLDKYIARERVDKRDDHGRQPLFTAREGRPSNTTVRSWTYLGTQPCLYEHRPHGRNRETCKYRHRNFASQCPSSRSPHQVRTGSIAWQLNCGIPTEEVSERLNSSPDVIRRHYDVVTGEERMEQRRREYLDNRSISKNVE